MPSHPKTTPDQRADIVEMYNEGRDYSMRSKGSYKTGWFTLAQIAEKHGISVTSAYYIATGQR